ncbi:MAG: hypothetical protein EA412_01945 [Chitinophagaceae bacterium]|nr:MAG: hypothetical protein EA412_01945 [Chitinophagaceae bacterium]
MNRILFLTFFLITVNFTFGQVKIGDNIQNIHPSAVFELETSDKGVLMPRLSTIQRDNDISTPIPAGLLIFNTDSVCLEVFDGSVWINLCNVSTLPANACTGVVPPSLDGHTYSIVPIGNQCWFAEDLRTSIFNNGTSIPFVEFDGNWFVSTPAYSIYYDGANSTYDDSYGFLYNHYAVREGTLCPLGWKVPDDEDWKMLAGEVDQTYNYGDAEWNGWGNVGDDAGQKLKSTTGWIAGMNGTDDYGFNGKPGGQRSTISPYGSEHFGDRSYYWTSVGNVSAILWRLNANSNQFWRDAMNPSRGNSIRCIKED